MGKLKQMKEDFEWVRRVIANENNRIIHYEAIKNLVGNFASKWKGKVNSSPDVYHQYVNYLKLKLKFEYHNHD